MSAGHPLCMPVSPSDDPKSCAAAARSAFFVGKDCLMNPVLFVFNSIMLGVGLAMDAFCVSMTNGLREPGMNGRRTAAISATYAGFQFLMPVIGWVCVSTIASYFKAFQKMIPWIALGLLCYIGGKMLYEGIRNKEKSAAESRISVKELMIQGIATSIDALSVGFTIASYSLADALLASLIIGLVTFVICVAGVKIGKKFGLMLAGKANIVGGLILIGIGLEIFLTGIV
jgi:putative Mn2+ efflux pump MntP